jgi:molybdenum-dependent DNA-binding transcriptional regulator ModE
MYEYKFRIVTGTDKNYVDAFDAIKADGEFIYEQITFDYLGHVGSEGISTNSDIAKVLDQGERVVPLFMCHFPNNWKVQIQRFPDRDPPSPFDTVTVNRPQQNQERDAVRFAKLIASVQKHLGKTSSLLGVANLLGPSVKQHFEAREIALARLEKAASDMLVEMEEGRKRREKELQEKERVLEAKYQHNEQELQATATQKTQDLERRSAELDALQKDLDDRAATHARRQHYKDIKEKFASWGKEFRVTPGTQSLRSNVYIFTIVLMVLFGGLAAFFLFQSITAVDALHLVPAIVKKATFTTLFVTTAVFFIKWNNQWFQRHANEEFHLKRMELDIDRASWFVEMAFEWKDEKGEEIPDALMS